MNCHPYIHITFISYHFYHEFTLSMQQNHSPLGHTTEKKRVANRNFSFTSSERKNKN